jgi:hypothetical protein
MQAVLATGCRCPDKEVAPKRRDKAASSGVDEEDVRSSCPEISEFHGQNPFVFDHFTRFRPSWPTGGFLPFSPFFFSTFSLKRLFFTLTALMMQ